MVRLKIVDPHVIQETILLTSQSLLQRIIVIPEIAAQPGAFEHIVTAGRLAYAESYRYVYYVSIGVYPFYVLHLKMLMI
jgi:hypothetical protein